MGFDVSPGDAFLGLGIREAGELGGRELGDRRGGGVEEPCPGCYVSWY